MKVHIQKFFGDMYTSIDEKPVPPRAQGVFFPGDLVHPKGWRRHLPLKLSSPGGKRQLTLLPGSTGVVIQSTGLRTDTPVVRLLTSEGVGDCYAVDIEVVDQ